MLKLIPQPKEIAQENKFIKNKSVSVSFENIDARICKALEKLPIDDNGIEVKLEIGNTEDESYELKVSENEILIKSKGLNGAFYAVQTLRQIFENDEIPCCIIKDKPDFKYRGVYLDITRGKIPTVETIKKFIDKIVYLKTNSLQLYVEHSYEFKEYSDIADRTGYITADELKEIDEYCRENFVDFIPSLSTFGHLYELLEIDRYKHLRMIKDFEPKRLLWIERAQHHTIDPLNPESIEVIKSLIDQYSPNFTSDLFNICCDETFDLKNGTQDKDTGEIYIGFVSQIIEHLNKKGKKIMMWGDVVLEHPERIGDIPDDVILLNWYYSPNPDKKLVSKFHDAGKRQILCTATWTWKSFCEKLKFSLGNIEDMARLGYEYKAEGILNTIWGDYGHTSCLELVDCGVAFGADKSWNVDGEKEKIFEKIDKLIYKTEGMSEYLKQLSEIQEKMTWGSFANFYSNKYFNSDLDVSCDYSKEAIEEFRTGCEDFCNRLAAEKYDNEHKKEMIIAAEALLVMCELAALNSGVEIQRHTDTEKWLKKYREAWLSKNKESELKEIETVFRAMEANAAPRK